MSWYLTDQVKSEQVLKKLETHALCYVKIWMPVDKPRTSELDYFLNHAIEEEQVSPLMETHCSFSYCP